MSQDEEIKIKKIDSHKDEVQEHPTEKKKAKSPQERLTPRASNIEPPINHDKQKCNCSNVHHDKEINCEICDSLKNVCPTITKNNCVKCFGQKKEISHSMILENRPCTRIELPARPLIQHGDTHAHRTHHNHQAIDHSYCPLNNRPPAKICTFQGKPIVTQSKPISKPIYQPVVSHYKPIVKQYKPIAKQIHPIITQNKYILPNRSHSIPSLRFTYQSPRHKNTIHPLSRESRLNPESHKKQQQMLDSILHEQLKNQLGDSKKSTRPKLFRHYNQESPFTRNSRPIDSSKE